jgi:hypothetical protein
MVKNTIDIRFGPAYDTRRTITTEGSWPSSAFASEVLKRKDFLKRKELRSVPLRRNLAGEPEGCAESSSSPGSA